MTTSLRHPPGVVSRSRGVRGRLSRTRHRWCCSCLCALNARRLARHRSGPRPSRRCRVSSRLPTRPSSVDVARAPAPPPSARAECLTLTTSNAAALSCGVRGLPSRTARRRSSRFAHLSNGNAVARASLGLSCRRALLTPSLAYRVARRVPPRRQQLTLTILVMLTFLLPSHGRLRRRPSPRNHGRPAGVALSSSHLLSLLLASSEKRWWTDDGFFRSRVSFASDDECAPSGPATAPCGYFILKTALSLSFLRSQLAQGFWLLCCCLPRGVVVCVVRGFAHFLSRAFKLTSFSIARRTIYTTRIWYRSAGFLLWGMGGCICTRRETVGGLAF